MAVKKTRELSGLLVYSYLKEDTFTVVKKMQCSKLVCDRGTVCQFL